MKPRSSIFWAVLLSLSSAPVIAVAAGQGFITSVKDRPNPYYTAEGGRLGAFILRPSLKLIRTYDDNIYRDREDKKNDRVTAFQPALGLTSDWGLHEFRLGVEAERGFYDDHSSENYTDFSFYLTGRFDVDYGTYLYADLRRHHGHEPRGSLEDPGGDRPLEYGVDTVTLGFIRDLSLLRLNILARHQDFEFENNRLLGLVIDNSVRNSIRDLVQARIGYGSSGNSEIYLLGRYAALRYDAPGAEYQDSWMYEGRLGVERDITGKTQLGAYLGYAFLENDGGFEDTQSLTYGASLLWNPSGLTSVKLGAERSLRQMTLANASSLILTALDIELEHALRRNVFVDAYLGMDKAEYNVVPSVQSQDNVTYNAGIGADYLMNENLSARMAYDYRERDYETGNRDYTNNIMSLSVNYDY